MATRGKGRTCASHRAAQKKYVAKNPGAQRARVATAYKKNASKIKAQKVKARKSAGPAKSAKGGKNPGKTGQKPSGRPKSC